MPQAILRLNDVKAKIKLSKTLIYALIKEGAFPAPFCLGGRAKGWLESEVDAWIEKQAAQRQAAAIK